MTERKKKEKKSDKATKEPKKRRITTASAKAKGRALQNWVGQRVADLIKLPFGRDEPVAAREMGQSGTDVRLVGEALQRCPFSIECKNQETFSLHAWITQAKANVIKGTEWLLFVKKNRMDPIVVLDADVFFKLLEQIPGDRKGLCDPKNKP